MRRAEGPGELIQQALWPGRLVRDRLADFRFVRILGLRHRERLGAGQDLEARVELDHGRSRLHEKACVALDLRRSVGKYGIFPG